MDQGDKVRITGTVLDAKPPAKIPELEPTWDQAKKILSSEEVFLRITEVEHVDRQQANTSNV